MMWGRVSLWIFQKKIAIDNQCIENKITTRGARV